MTLFKTLLLSAVAIGAMNICVPARAEMAMPGAPTANDTKAKLPFDESQKAAMEDFVRNFILDNPEVLMESVNRYRAEMAAKSDEEAVKNLGKYTDNLYNGSHPEIGNSKGDITVVEFFDFNCGYCKRALDTVKKTVENDKGVRVVFIELPILSPTSTTAAKWALAANKQGKYWELHKAMLESSAPKDDANIEKMAKEVGIDVAKAKLDVADKSLDDVLKKNAEIAHSLGITGTPGFIVGKKILRGYAEYDSFKAILEQERADAKNKK